MNPSLLYGQAIQGRYSRSIGVIDTLHLTEVARAKILCSSPSFPTSLKQVWAMVSNLFDVDQYSRLRHS